MRISVFLRSQVQKANLGQPPRHWKYGKCGDKDGDMSNEVGRVRRDVSESFCLKLLLSKDGHDVSCPYKRRELHRLKAVPPGQSD